MRHGHVFPVSDSDLGMPRSDWATLRRLIPYLLQYKSRVIAAMAFMLLAKLANVTVPLVLKQLIDTVNGQLSAQVAMMLVPVGLLMAYGALRLSTSLFTELRELLFSKATQGAARSIALATFEHLHALSLRFHLDRQTGGMTRDIERGVRGIESLISFTFFNIFATAVEIALVLTVLATQFDMGFVWITVTALFVYIVFTVAMTEWRTQFRRQANAFDSAAHTRAVDSLLNYETVKYFNNESFESQRYDTSLQQLRVARLKAQSTLSMLNAGQQCIIAVGLVAMLWRATQGVVDGRMSLGDLVMVNAFMIQLYIPLNFLGVVYREIKQSLTDLDKMFTLMDKPCEVQDSASAHAPEFIDPPTVRFENVYFHYEPAGDSHAEKWVPLLSGISFEIPAGKKVAIVGASGSGKSTLARLLFRFYDVQNGRITVNGQDIRNMTQASLRAAIGIVPQDTVLFNDTVYYNIAYGRPSATQAEVQEAAKLAQIHTFVVNASQGYETMVGERGLKLSGGEKQRIAIARTLLKNPPIMVFDEATSALDSANERAIQEAIKQVFKNKTMLVIAHRLSTIVDAHEILVMESGAIVERGTHEGLLARNGRYAAMWATQQSVASQ